MLEVVVSSIGQMVGLCAIGWLVDRPGYTRPEDYARWSRVAVDFLLPMLVFHAIVSGLDTGQFSEVWMLPLLGLALMGLGWGLGLVFKWGLAVKTPHRTRTFVHIASVNNFGFLPIYIIANLIEAGLMDVEMLALLFVFNLGSMVGFWTIGVITLSGGASKEIARNLLSPSLVAILVAIGIAHFGGKEWMPEIIMKTAKAAGGVSVPLMLIITGATLRGAFRQERIRDVAYTTAVRNLIIPGMCIVLASYLPFSNNARFLWTVVAVMPAAATTPIMARVYGGSVEFGSAVVVVSTVFGIVSIPLGLYLADLI